jgi:hypothetical protein
MKDDFFDKKYSTEKEESLAKTELQGKLQMIDELVGLPYFIQSFKVLQVK